MLPVWLLLMLNGLFVTLRLSGGEGSFPRPLKAEEERACLEAMAAGDPEARDRLIEHNLRLVAHIVKNGWSKRPMTCTFSRQRRLTSRYTRRIKIRLL